MLWIRGPKSFAYEDECLAPFVANSPFMSFFYRQPAGEYREHMNREGELVPAKRTWHEQNGTCMFAYGLGSVTVVYGVPIALHAGLPRVGAVGGFLVFVISLVTLSLLVTTPEAWVQSLGSPEYGFPLLSGAGRLVIMNEILMGAALVTLADSAKAHLRKRDVATRKVVRQREVAPAASKFISRIATRTGPPTGSRRDGGPP